MKINIKTRMGINVRERKTIGFKDIRTIKLLEINKNALVGDSIVVKRV